jgi:flagellar L-ring protein FlgH
MKKVLFAIFIILISGAALCDSLWDRTSTSPYSVSKSFRVGDMITVIILETTSAVQKAGTDTDVNDSLSAALDHTITRLNIDPTNYLKANGGNQYSGSGSTARSSKVTAKIAAVITRILPNGNLLISGEHKVEVNNEIQTIKISGMVRPKDVTLMNTVLSYQVAGASVSVKGSGVVGEADEPGWFSRMFNWVF